MTRLATAWMVLLALTLALASGAGAQTLIRDPLPGGGAPASGDLSFSANDVPGGTDVQATVVLGSGFGCETVPISIGLSTVLVDAPPSVQACPPGGLFGPRVGSFTITTSPTPYSGSAPITAAGDTEILRVRPPYITSLSVSPDAIVGHGVPNAGAEVAATLRLDGPLPEAGCYSVRKISSVPAAAQFAGIPGHPSCLQADDVSADRRQVAMTVHALGVSEYTQVALRVEATETNAAATGLTVLPLALSAVEASPAAVAAGEAGRGIVRLNGEAGPGGIDVLLSSEEPARVSVPPSVHVEPGSDEASFEITTEPAAGCAQDVEISATLGAITRTVEIELGSAQVLGSPATWGGRAPVASGPAGLWTDGDDVLFDADGTGPIVAQAREDGAGNDLGAVAEFVMALGPAATPGAYIGAWRRGTDDAWIWDSASGIARRVDPTSPLNPQDTMNPEGAAVSGDCAFVIFQAPVPGTQTMTRLVFNTSPDQIDAVSGGIIPVPVAGLDPNSHVSRITADRDGRCEFAWITRRALAPDVLVHELFYWDDGSIEVVVIEGATESRRVDPQSLRVDDGRVAWTQEDAASISQVYLMDMRAADPAPVQLTFETDPDRGCFRPALDGAHLAWMCGGNSKQQLDVIAHGGLVLSDADSRAHVGPETMYALQIRGGQVLWHDERDGLQLLAGGTRQSLCLSPAAGAELAWLTPEQVVYLGRRADAGVFAPREAFRLDTTPQPDDAPISVQVDAGDGELTVRWAELLDADAYSVYLARDPGVGPAQHELAFPDASSPLTIDGLSNGTTYHLVVTAVRDGVEGTPSLPVSGTPTGAWSPVGDSADPFHALAVDALDDARVYAGTRDGALRSEDAGLTWTRLDSAISGRDVRALAAHGDLVLAVTADGDVLRSTDAGASWSVTADGVDYGVTSHAIAIDPADPDRVYAGNLILDTGRFDPGLAGSTQGGAPGSWAHLDSGEMQAHALAIDALSSVYAGGTGTPFAGRSDDGGVSWDALDPPEAIAALATDADGSGVWAGTLGAGVQYSADRGASWQLRAQGLPAGENVRGLAVDATRDGTLFAGTGAGAFHSVDAGMSWTELEAGLDAPAARGVQALAIAGPRLLAATLGGLYALELGPAPGVDSDGDGVADLLDSCPWYATPDQTDSDGDGRGDACECGDQNGDGAVNVSDILAINAAIFDTALVTPLCDANADGQCDVGDVLAVNASIFGAELFCARHPAP